MLLNLDFVKFKPGYTFTLSVRTKSILSQFPLFVSSFHAYEYAEYTQRAVRTELKIFQFSSISANSAIEFPAILFACCLEV